MLTEQELFVYVALELALSLYPSWRLEYLFKINTTGAYCFSPSLKWGKYMSLNRFQLIRSKIRRVPEVFSSSGDSFAVVKQLVDVFNKRRECLFFPGRKLVTDESMCCIYGKVRPHTTKISRKPKGVGIEIKNLANCESGILLRLEIVGLKEEIRRRQYSEEFGAGTALVLRLTHLWKSSGRVVIAKSAFASVKIAVRLCQRAGLHVLGLFKTTHREYPKKWLQQVEHVMENTGDFVALTAEKHGVTIKAKSCNDKKRKNLVVTYGTTLHEEPHRKKRWKVHEDGSLEIYFKEVPRNSLTAEYSNGAQIIDVHNHIRQSGLSLEEHSRKSKSGVFFKHGLE